MRKPTPKAWELLEKLQALAERGIDGERQAAQHKLARLKARFDFAGAAAEKRAADQADMFKGRFPPSRNGKSVRICKFTDYAVANSVKWAIEKGAGVPCQWRDGELRAEVSPTTAKNLAAIALKISESFLKLWDKFSRLDGVHPADRGIFIMGLYDGMMNDGRTEGQPIPRRPVPVVKVRKTKKPPAPAPAAAPSGLHIHPYTIALDWGRQIRFSVPWETIAGEIEALAAKQLSVAGE